MELELSKEQINANLTPVKTKGEHIENIEIIVPDYLPDASKIVKTDALVLLKDKSVTSDKITISAEIVFNALYLPENMTELKSIKTKVPFKSVFNVNLENSDVKIKADLYLVLVEGSIVNSRKISLKAVIGVEALAFGLEQIDVINKITDSDNKELEMLTKPAGLFIISSVAQKEFNIEEELYLPIGKKLIGELLKNSVSVTLTDKKVISNKVIIKGCVSLKTLYTALDDPNIIESVENEIPFSTIADVDGIEEDAIADVSFNLTDISVKPSKDNDGDLRILSVSFNLLSMVTAYKNIQIDTIVDAYSTQFSLELFTKELIASRFVYDKSVPLVLKDTIRADGEGLDIKRVIDISEIWTPVEPVIDGDTINLKGNIEVSLICAGGEDGEMLFGVKKVFPYSVEQSITEKVSLAQVSANLSKVSSSYNLNMSDEVEIRVAGDINFRLTDVSKMDLLEDVVIKERKTDDKTTSLLFAYYPQKGDTVFNVAKRYGIKISDLININKLECRSFEDELDTDMLLIPFKRN